MTQRSFVLGRGSTSTASAITPSDQSEVRVNGLKGGPSGGRVPAVRPPGGRAPADWPPSSCGLKIFQFDVFGRLCKDFKNGVLQSPKSVKNRPKLKSFR